MFGHLTYIVFELGWALPVLALQWAVGRGTLWRRRKTLLISILIPTIYLSCADAVAIASGIWTLHDTRIVELRVGALPVEEALFFLVTNAMVAQSIILFEHWRRR